MIIALRRSTTRREYAVASCLKRDEISVNHSTVYNILKRNRLINPLQKPRMRRACKRFACIFASFFLDVFIN
jgi:hypothetical protein